MLKSLPPEVEGRIDLAVKHRQVATGLHWSFTNGYRNRSLRRREQRHRDKAQRLEARAAAILAVRLTPSLNGGRPVVKLVKTRRGCEPFEKEDRYDVLVDGALFDQLYFNLRGYVGYLPTENGGRLTIGERGISAYRSEVARINRGK